MKRGEARYLIAQAVAKAYAKTDNGSDLLFSNTNGNIRKYSEDQPRDENGRFAGRTGGSYSSKNIIGTTTTTGTVIKSASKHMGERMHQRHISADEVNKVLTDPDTKVSKGHTERTSTYDNNGLRVVVDEVDGKAVTCMRRR